MQVFYGDLHNHCGLSYGQGTLEEALCNARLQLDFASVTIHATWPDLPLNDPNLDYLVEYHRDGFRKAQHNWSEYLATLEAQNVDGRFVTFPSFEWHSLEYGDYCVYYKNGHNRQLIKASDLPALRRALQNSSSPALLIPHHIGYKQGSRGINWATFSDKLSPVVEIFSFHGLSENSEGTYPYLHSMGPRHAKSTAQYGWSQGHIFGVVGSTDHHNATPGSYGYGRMGVWAEALSRDAIWEAVKQRRTYALTGDRIELIFALNDAPMGSIAPPNDKREIAVTARGGGSLDYIDVLHNNQLLHRETVFPSNTREGIFKIYVEAGWGEQTEAFDWQVALEIENGVLRDVEPRFRGYGPTDHPSENVIFAYSHLEKSESNHVSFKTKTRKNASLHTASTEGIAIEVEGTAETRLLATINGQHQELRLAELMAGAHSIYMGGFVSPVLCFHRAVPLAEYSAGFTFSHDHHGNQRDWYTVRVRQHNDQWAWSSPIWIEDKAT